MDQKKIGTFLRDLRKEKGLTQEELAEKLYVNNRTISRWENARTMPDFDVLIELAKLYDVSVEELLNGKKTADDMEKQTEANLYNIAEYTNREKERLTRNQHYFAWVGVIAWLVFLVLQYLGMAEEGTGETVASFAAGVAFGMAVLAVFYTSKYFQRFRSIKMRILQKDQKA